MHQNAGLEKKFRDLEMSYEAIRRERMYRELAPVARASRDAIGRTPANYEREKERERESERERERKKSVEGGSKRDR